MAQNRGTFAGATIFDAEKNPNGKNRVQLTQTPDKVFTPQNFKSKVLDLSLNPNVLIRCPDQWVGDVACKNMGFEYSNAGSQEFVKRQNLIDVSMIMPVKRLIIVLESPHLDEFKFCIDSQEQSFVGPANGKTGENIRKYLEVPTQEFSSLSFVKPNDNFALILMNSVPYQCSLGNSLSGPHNIWARKTRDMVFRACWEKAKQDFCERLSGYLTEQTLVINACTRGENKGGSGGRWLRDLVEDAIVSCNVPCDRHARRCHPSSLQNWKTGKSWNRQIAG